MDEKTYRETVIKLLAVQHEYFRLRKQSDLIESKRLEKVLREENARWLADQNDCQNGEVKQPGLFE